MGTSVFLCVLACVSTCAHSKAATSYLLQIFLLACSHYQLNKCAYIDFHLCTHSHTHFEWFNISVSEYMTAKLPCRDQTVQFQNKHFSYLFIQVFFLLFLFAKRQIMRFALRSARKPHISIGADAPRVSLLVFKLFLWLFQFIQSKF